MPAEAPRFTCADRGFLPPWSFTLNFTGADCGFLPPSFDSRVQIRPFCSRRPVLMLSRTATRARSARGASQFAAGYADTLGATCKSLSDRCLTIFRVVVFLTLILAKWLVVCNLRAAPLELQVCMATRSPCEDQALPLRGPLPLVPRAVSPHRGNLVAGYNGFG